MYKALFPWAAGLTVQNLSEAIAIAKMGGFEGVEFNPGEVADLIEAHGVDHVRSLFAGSGIKPAGFGLPTDWRTTEENLRAGLAALPRQAQAAAAIGCTRTSTWILPGDNERSLDENRAHHVARFRPIAKILGDFGISLGLEFIGPKTLRDTFKFPFIHTMRDMLEMGAEIGPNVGVLLDCWHWYTSHGTVGDLRSLTPAQVVYVHVNDAPAGLAVDEQQDTTRCLPGETGVIDIAAFLRTLQEIGYDGPVTPEPFKKELKDLPSDEARVKMVGASMDKIFSMAGIS